MEPSDEIVLIEEVFVMSGCHNTNIAVCETCEGYGLVAVDDPTHGEADGWKEMDCPVCQPSRVVKETKEIVDVV